SDNKSSEDTPQDEEMLETLGEGETEQETASLAVKGEAGDEMAELRQTYEAAQKQFGETGAQEYLRGTIHECDRMLRNCGEEVYPSAEFNYIYASALHDYSLVGAEPEELNGFVDMALEYVGLAADQLDKAKDKEWLWRYYLVAGKVHLQKVDTLFEDQEAASSKKQFKLLGKEIQSELMQATNLLDAGFKLIPDGDEKYIVRIEQEDDDETDDVNKAKSTLEKVSTKLSEMNSAAANVALHADRMDDYEPRKQWNEWALKTYRQVTEGWWADQGEEDEDEEDEDEDEEDDKEPEDEYSLPVYTLERGQLSLQALEAIEKAIQLARDSNTLSCDLLTLGAECHINLVNIAVGDKAAAKQSKAAVALIKEAISTYPNAGLDEKYGEVLTEFEEIAANA
ncbi:hypothetical protein BGW38_004679, partial [Lunasporangiospora selenospora]